MDENEFSLQYQYKLKKIKWENDTIMNKVKEILAIIKLSVNQTLI